MNPRNPQGWSASIMACIPLLMMFVMPIAHADWMEGFEDYAIGVPPPPEWHRTGHQDIIVDDLVAYSGDKSLRVAGVLGGCWSGGANCVFDPDGPITYPFVLEVSIYNGDEDLHGCNPYRGGAHLVSGPEWTDPGYQLILFHENGDFEPRIGHYNGTTDRFSDFELNRWYRVRVELTRPGDGLLHTKYWVNGDFVIEQTLAEAPLMDNLWRVSVGCWEGTAWIDDVCAHSLPEEAQTVSVDIKPGSCPNPLNVKGYDATDELIWTGGSNVPADNVFVTMKGGPKSGKTSKAVFPVAILGGADLDVMEIDRASITLAGVAPIRAGIEDVATPVDPDAADCDCNTLGPDGYTDLTLKFSKAEIIAVLGPVSDGDVVSLTLTATLADGTPLEGVDCVLIRGDKDPSPRAVAGPVFYAPYPNPANPSTSFAVDFPEATDYALTIYNIMGQQVWQHRSHSHAGRVTVTWNGRNSAGGPVASGVYFARLTAGAYPVQERRLTLLK